MSSQAVRWRRGAKICRCPIRNGKCCREHTNPKFRYHRQDQDDGGRCFFLITSWLYPINGGAIAGVCNFCKEHLLALGGWQELPAAFTIEQAKQVIEEILK